jgi:hypothetical protein
MTGKQLAAALGRLLDEGGTANRLVIQQDHAFFVAHGAKGASEVAIEAAASYYLPKDRRLDTAQVNGLRSRGFTPHPPLRCLRRRYARTDLRRAGTEVLALLSGLYGAEGELRLTEQVGDFDPTSNPRLVGAMSEAAKKRDQPSRFALYRAVMASTLLVPVEDGELRVMDELSGFDVFGCFTDPEQVQRHEPRGVELLRVRGRRLVHRLLERKAGSLLINPGGTLRGELYRAELQSIADAMSPRPAVDSKPSDD